MEYLSESALLYREKYKKWKHKYGWPDFEPYNGKCYYCGKQIYDHPGTRMDIDNEEPITGCRWCCHSFVD